jgi:hypothetical protein
MRPGIRRVGLPDPTMASSFPSSPSWFSTDRRPPKLSLWVHPLARFPSPTEFLASLPARRLPAPSTFLGVSCPIAAQPAESTYTVPGFHQAPRRGHPKPTSFRPRRFSRPRRLPPPLTLRVYFAPQPRPGFALQGFPLGCSRTNSSLACCPLNVLTYRLPPSFTQWAPAPGPRFQGFAPLPNPLQTAVV